MKRMSVAVSLLGVALSANAADSWDAHFAYESSGGMRDTAMPAGKIRDTIKSTLQRRGIDPKFLSSGLGDSYLNFTLSGAYVPQLSDVRMVAMGMSVFKKVGGMSVSVCSSTGLAWRTVSAQKFLEGVAANVDSFLSACASHIVRR
ncbi:hypothetical protein [Achromobacter denitrificans]|uniref:hypothetical protein n=1 Tax=Achromobacter denitrificans TaxID=32002 RepID=UPI00166531E3|nr:hypothetical protein [Achromobacter denitrificans]